MQPLNETEALDRHALVMAIWLALGFIAVILFDYGFGAGGIAAIAAGFIAVLAAFAGHVITNAVYASDFTTREVALGLVLYAASLVTLALAALLAPDFASRNFLPLSLGFVAIAAAVIIYMIIRFGLRRSFDAFDVISDFRSRRTRNDTPDGGIR
ncbi:hypothetical protein [Taklimakanibacter lacteus]|uniref:hypothetical protein n=1 Tax=Taklimakanibacter lacteus TaxID=2268456 RepID=UPI000E66FC3D